MFQSSLLEDSHIQPLADAAMQVLRDVGILCQNEGLRQAHFRHTRDPLPQNLALPIIREVGLGMSLSYTETQHTLDHFRRCLWLPEFVDRSGYPGFAHEEELLARARARVRELLAQYRRPEGREEKLAAMRQVLERASRELCQ